MVSDALVRCVGVVAEAHERPSFERVYDDYVEHTPVPGQGPGLAGLKDSYRMFNEPFPDVKFVFDDVMGIDVLALMTPGEDTATVSHQQGGSLFGGGRAT